MGKHHLHEAKLDNILFKTFKVELVHLSPVQQFDVNVSDHRVDFGLRSEVEHPVFF